MWGKVAVVLSLVGLVFLGAMTINCGGSSNSLGTCNGPMGPAYNVAGDWTLSVTGSDGSYPNNPGMISTAGLAIFFEPVSESGAGDTAVLPTISGASNCFSGNITSYATPFNGGATVTDQAIGTIKSATSITGSFQGSTASGTFTLAPSTPLTGSVTALSGSGWLGEVVGANVPDILQITLSATGSNNMTLQGTDRSNCTVTGTFTEEGGAVPNLNVFDVSITYTGSSCSVSGTQTGLGFESNSDYFDLTGNPPASGAYLYAVPSASASILEIYKPPVR